MYACSKLVEMFIFDRLSYGTLSVNYCVMAIVCLQNGDVFWRLRGTFSNNSTFSLKRLKENHSLFLHLKKLGITEKKKRLAHVHNCIFK